MWFAAAAVAVAQDVVLPRVDETLIVEDRRTEAAALHDLESAIRDLGYIGLVRIGGVRRYVPLAIWRPSITIREWGDVRIRGRTFTPMSLIVAPGPYAAVSGVMGGPRTARSQESAVRASLLPWIQAWDAARLARGAHERESQVRTSLELLWAEGVGFHRETLASWEERRCAIREFYATRTNTGEGQAVQAIVAGFVETVVQHSPEPYGTTTGCPRPE